MLSLVLVGLLGVDGGRHVIDDVAHSFRFSLPDGYVATNQRVPGDKKPKLGIWVRNPDPQHLVIVSLEAMGAPLKRGEDQGLGWIGEPINVKWKTFVLQAMRKKTSGTNGDTVMYAVQFPAKPVAIMLIVTGPAFNEADVLAEFDDALASFEAPTNWVTEFQRRAPSAARVRSKSIITPKMVLLFAVFLGVLAFRFSVRRRK